LKQFCFTCDNVISKYNYIIVRQNWPNLSQSLILAPPVLLGTADWV